MNMFKMTLVAGAVAVSGSAALAATITIDSFDTAQAVGDNPLPPALPATSTIAAGDVLGGSRTMTVSTAPATLVGSQLVSGGGVLTFSNNAGQIGEATVEYGVAGGGIALGDLTDGMTNDKFFFEILSGDLPGTSFSAMVEDTDGAMASVTELLQPGFSPFQNFADFAGVDFTKVASLTFTLDSNGIDSFDGSIGSISAVPLPASALLLLGGIGGMAIFGSSKRRRKN